MEAFDDKEYLEKMKSKAMQEALKLIGPFRSSVEGLKLGEHDLLLIKTFLSRKIIIAKMQIKFIITCGLVAVQNTYAVKLLKVPDRFTQTDSNTSINLESDAHSNLDTAAKSEAGTRTDI